MAPASAEAAASVVPEAAGAGGVLTADAVAGAFVVSAALEAGAGVALVLAAGAAGFFAADNAGWAARSKDPNANTIILAALPEECFALQDPNRDWAEMRRANSRSKTCGEYIQSSRTNQ